nr:MAG TPA: hypothetical protein [Caudoviricetes sp.]
MAFLNVNKNPSLSGLFFPPFPLQGRRFFD